MNAEPIRVLLIDDHALLRAKFRTILETQPDITVMSKAGTGLLRDHAPSPAP